MKKIKNKAYRQRMREEKKELKQREKLYTPRRLRAIRKGGQLLGFFCNHPKGLNF